MNQILLTPDVKNLAFKKTFCKIALIFIIELSDNALILKHPKNKFVWKLELEFFWLQIIF